MYSTSEPTPARCHPERSEGSWPIVLIQDPSSQAPQDDSGRNWLVFYVLVLIDAFMIYSLFFIKAYVL
jgi:hypothetical protein